MATKELISKIKELNLPLGSYALFGSAPMCIRGMRECRDLDVLVSQAVWQEFWNKPEWEKKKTENGSDCLSKDGIDMVLEWKPGDWDAQKLIAEAEIIDGLPFVKLQEVIRWKMINGRDKDLKDIQLIEERLLKK